MQDFAGLPGEIPMAKHVTVLGAGRVGRAMALDLAQDGEFEVRVADASAAALGSLAGAAHVETTKRRSRRRAGGAARARRRRLRDRRGARFHGLPHARERSSTPASMSSTSRSSSRTPSGSTRGEGEGRLRDRRRRRRARPDQRARRPPRRHLGPPRPLRLRRRRAAGRPHAPLGVQGRLLAGRRARDLHASGARRSRAARSSPSRRSPSSRPTSSPASAPSTPSSPTACAPCSRPSPAAR